MLIQLKKVEEVQIYKILCPVIKKERIKKKRLYWAGVGRSYELAAELMSLSARPSLVEF